VSHSASTPRPSPADTPEVPPLDGLSRSLAPLARLLLALAERRRQREKASADNDTLRSPEIDGTESAGERA
jgi:hypothetical protein